MERAEILNPVYEVAPSNSPLSTGQMAPLSSKLFEERRQHTHTHTATRMHTNTPAGET